MLFKNVFVPVIENLLSRFSQEMQKSGKERWT